MLTSLEISLMMDTPYAINNHPHMKEIALAVSLLVFGVVGFFLGLCMTAIHVGDDAAHGIFFTVLGTILFIPGFYLYKDSLLCLEGIQGLLLCQHSTCLEVQQDPD